MLARQRGRTRPLHAAFSEPKTSVNASTRRQLEQNMAALLQDTQLSQYKNVLQYAVFYPAPGSFAPLAPRFPAGGRAVRPCRLKKPKKNYLETTGCITAYVPHSLASGFTRKKLSAAVDASRYIETRWSPFAPPANVSTLGVQGLRITQRVDKWVLHHDITSWW
jgi:hypothetical protein